MRAAAAQLHKGKKTHVPDFAARMDTTIEAAARRLGADAESAAHIRANSTLVADGMPVLMMKLPPLNHLAAGLLMCLDTGTPVPDGQAANAALLQQAAGLLLARGVGLGATDERRVALFRFVPAAALTPRRLAEEVLALRDLATVARSTAAIGGGEA